MKYHILPAEIKKRMDVTHGSHFEFAVAGAICIFVLAIYSFFTGNGLLAGIAISMLFCCCALWIRKTEKVERNIYEKTIEFCKDGILVWMLDGTCETIDYDRVCAIEDKELKLCWDRGYSLYDASPIKCHLLIVCLDGIYSFDELRWKSEEGRIYKASEIYQDKRCLVLPYTTDIMENAVAAWQKGQMDRLNDNVYKA